MARPLDTMQRALGRLFKPAKTKAKPDPAYATFRAYCAAQGLTYTLARDGYLEFSNGQTFAHHGDWAETLDRLKAGDGQE